jgi:hypothetical protein
VAEQRLRNIFTGCESEGMFDGRDTLVDEIDKLIELGTVLRVAVSHFVETYKPID